MTETGSLIYGIEYPANSGRLHYEFELRLPIMSDELSAIDLLGAAALNGQVNQAVMARAMVRLGDIPPEQITYELLWGGLHGEDYAQIEAAQERLKKKRKQSSGGSQATDSPSLSSAATDSTNLVSAA